MFEVLNYLLLAGGEGEGEGWDSVNEANVVEGFLAFEDFGAELGGAEARGEGVGDEEAGAVDGFVVGALCVEGGDA